MTKNLNKSITFLYQIIINGLWVIVSIICLILTGKEFIILYNLFNSNKDINELLHVIVNIFLLIEIITMIKKYFEENFHFPLRYLLYISITIIARHIIVDFENVVAYSFSILLLIVSYIFLKIKE